MTGVATGSRGGETGLTLAAQAAVLGVVLLAGSTVVGFDALDVDASAGPDLGLGPILRIVDLLLAGLAVLDEVLLAGGAAALLAGAGAAGLALLRRERVVVVSVSGGDPIRLPAADPGRAAERVRALLAREASA